MANPNDAAAGVLALGDSYTVGTGVNPEDRWVDRVVRRLRARGFEVAGPTVIAADGWTAADLATAIDDRSIDDNYDLVSLLVGANDVFNGRPATSFRPTYVDLLERAIGAASNGSEGVLVLTIPDYTPTPVGQQNEPAKHAARLTSYNRLIEAEAANRGVRVVDVEPISRRVREDGNLIAEDGLHPSPAQHERWAEKILPAVVELLDE